MNDERRSRDMSVFEGYTLGRLSAQNQQVLGDAAEAFGRRLLRPPAATVDVNALIAENEMLRRQLAATQADLSELEGIYSRLKAWGIQASQVLDHYGLITK